MTSTYSMMLGGREMTLETGRLAKQAGGAVLVTYGETVVLVSATGSSAPREGVDFFPLTVDYEERMYAVGKIPGNWFRREARPSTKAILSARLTDRPIRPLFPDGYRNDVQIVVTVMSVDNDHAPEICGMIGASAALTISDIPFEGPIAAVIVGLIDGEFVINPSTEQAERSEMHLVVAGTKQAVLMVEAGANEVPEEVMLDAILYAHDVIKNTIIPVQEKMQAEVGKPKLQVTLFLPPADLAAAVRAAATEKLRGAYRNPDKLAREEAIASVGNEVQQQLAGEFPDKGKQIKELLKSILKEEVRRAIVDEGIRPDGRKLDEIRAISCDISILPRTHGTGLFQRGQTQVLSVTTLGTLGDVQKLDDLGIEEEKRYMHHYNFPPFSVGEARPMRGPGRREIGHGALAERAMLPVLPGEDTFPYAIRVVSEVLESNGSTSMGSVCGSTLSLMDAGVPIKAPVAGVAMGLVESEDGRYAVLSDIQGMEDALGDMDFKVAGTAKGVTALQMDMKISGTGREVLGQALTQAKAGRMFILGKMLECIDTPRTEMSPYAPRIIIMKIDPDKIREVIGKGGSMINKIIEESRVGDKKVEINIEDDGTIHIASVNKEAGAKAVAMIEALTQEIEPGGTYEGKVMRLMNFGAFVEFLPGKEGLVHISQLAEGRVENVEDVVNVGDTLLVKLMEVDKLGRMNLSHKEALRDQLRAQGLPVPEDPPEEERRERRPSGGGGFGGGGRSGGGGYGGGGRSGGGGSAPAGPTGPSGVSGMPSPKRPPE